MKAIDDRLGGVILGYYELVCAAVQAVDLLWWKSERTFANRMGFLYFLKGQNERLVLGVFLLWPLVMGILLAKGRVSIRVFIWGEILLCLASLWEIGLLVLGWGLYALAQLAGPILVLLVFAGAPVLFVIWVSRIQPADLW